MNKILAECIKKLNQLKEGLKDIEANSDMNKGVNCANSLISQSIDTRCSLIEEIYGEPEPGEIHTDAEYALYCIEFTDSLRDVLKEDIEGAGDTDFDKGFKYQMRQFLKMLKPLEEWLQKTSLEDIYS